jgi:hypothetical protein
MLPPLFLAFGYCLAFTFDLLWIIQDSKDVWSNGTWIHGGSLEGMDKFMRAYLSTNLSPEEAFRRYQENRKQQQRYGLDVAPDRTREQFLDEFSHGSYLMEQKGTPRPVQREDAQVINRLYENEHSAYRQRVSAWNQLPAGANKSAISKGYDLLNKLRTARSAGEAEAIKAQMRGVWEASDRALADQQRAPQQAPQTPAGPNVQMKLIAQYDKFGRLTGKSSYKPFDSSNNPLKEIPAGARLSYSRASVKKKPSNKR